MPLTTRSSPSKRHHKSSMQAKGVVSSGRCTPRVACSTPSPQKRKSEAEPTPQKVEKQGICQGKSVTARVDKLTKDHDADKQWQEERAREESFEALTGDVSQGDRKQRDRLYSCFKRQMANPKDASQRSIAEDWDKACSSKSRTQQTKMFKLWFSCAGDSKRMVAKWRLSSSETQWSTDAHAWVTRDQLVKHYNNADVAESIIEEKMNANLWRPHPELPGDESARLYFCLYEMKSGETKKKASAKLIEGSTAMNPEDDEAVGAMIKGVTGHGVTGHVNEKEEDTANKEETKKEEQQKKGDAAKEKKKEQPKKGGAKPSNLHGPPDSSSEKEDDPEDLLETWMSVILKDSQTARKIQLGLKHQPSQRIQAQALLDGAKTFEGYWSQLNEIKKDGPQAYRLLIQKCHDEIGEFRKQIKVGKGALSGIDTKKKKVKKEGASKGSSKSSS